MSDRLFCLACLIVLGFPAIAHAEDDPPQFGRIVVGGQIGIVWATSEGSDQNDNAGDIEYRAGFAASGIFGLHLTSILSVQAEIGFSGKGQRFATDFPGSTSNWYISYFEVPLLLLASVPVSERIAPYGYLGPSVAFLLDADVKYDDGRFFETNRLIEPLDVGLMLGAGAAVDLATVGALTLDFRYNLGLRNTIRNPVGDSEAFNRAIYLTVGYRADLATLGRLFGRGSRPRGPAEPARPGTAPEPPPGARR